MIWRLNDLIKSARSNHVYINGRYVPARPLFSLSRWKGTWLVFTGKADAVIWPEGQ